MIELAQRTGGALSVPRTRRWQPLRAGLIDLFLYDEEELRLPYPHVMPSAVDGFEAHRSRLFGLAYRLLGSAEEAEEVVQDAFLRWSGAEQAAIVSPSAWLAKVVTNLCLNRMTSARARRERYVGLWLPEPVLTADGSLGPLETIERRESVSMALLVLLERLTPAERAVFVLREAFRHRYRDIAEILDTTDTNCRQLHRRALRRLGERPRFHPRPEEARRLVEQFLAAAEQGDVRGLEQLLAEDVTYGADGGGKAPAARRTVAGRERVARLIAGGVRKFTGGMGIAIVETNGTPAVLAWSGGELVGVMAVDVVAGRIAALRLVANPDKLAFAAAQATSLSRIGALPGPIWHDTSDPRDWRQWHAWPGGGGEAARRRP